MIAVVWCGSSQGAALVDERPAEEQISALAPEVRRLMANRQKEVTSFLLHCAVQLGHKVANYAMLIGEVFVDTLLCMRFGRRSWVGDAHRE